MIPIARDSEGGSADSCAFCGRDTLMWTALASREPGEQVACCKRCAARHAPRDVPTKAAWCLRPHAEAPKPRGLGGAVNAAHRAAREFNRASLHRHVEYGDGRRSSRRKGSWVSGRAFVNTSGEVMVPLEHEDRAVPLRLIRLLPPVKPRNP